jgi:hypothetical protein
MIHVIVIIVHHIHFWAIIMLQKVLTRGIFGNSRFKIKKYYNYSWTVITTSFAIIPIALCSELYLKCCFGIAQADQTFTIQINMSTQSKAFKKPLHYFLANIKTQHLVLAKFINFFVNFWALFSSHIWALAQFFCIF